MHISRYRFPVLVYVTALLIALVMQVPQWLHMRDARYQGVLVHLNSDEAVYLAHLEEALTGRPQQSTEAIVGDAELMGTHTALLERIEAAFFAATGWRAATVEQMMDSIFPPLIFLALVLLFSLCGVSRGAAYLGALAFVFVEFYSLNRPVQPRGSFLLLILACSGIIAGLDRRIIFGMFGGALLGILIGIYFWAWTFGWLWLGLVGLFEVIVWAKPRSVQSKKRVLRVLLFGLIGAIAAIPALSEWWRIAHHPLYEFAAFRSGMHPSRLPESLPYSVLFTVMVAGVLRSLWSQWGAMRRYRFLALTVLAGFIAIHQQLVHGIVFNFVSHYLFSLVVCAVSVVLLAHALRTRVLMISACAAIIYLAALTYDGRHVFKQFTVTAERFSEQHFATLLPILDDLSRATILSDPETSLFLAASTHHDVPYTMYLKNVLMTHEEIAERFCLTQIPVPPDERHLGEQMPIYPDSDSAFNDDPLVHQQEVEMVTAACAKADRDPVGELTSFHVHYILWDEQRKPEWKLDRLRIALKKVAEAPGWSLWSFNP